MKCPFCRLDNDRVIDSRSGEGGFVTRRRRHCQSCERRYTTYERVAELEIRVVKKTGDREPFSADKIRRGLHRACWKRSVSDEDIEFTIARIEQKVFADFDDEIPSAELGRIVMDHLFELDQVAYIRFASVYREFTDAQDFVEEVQQMLKRFIQ